MKYIAIILTVFACQKPDACLPYQMIFSDSQCKTFTCPAGHTHRVTYTYTMHSRVMYIHNMATSKQETLNQKLETDNR